MKKCVGVACTVLGLLAGCGDGGSVPATLTHEFEPFEIGSGEEQLDFCQSWKLNNAEPIFVSAISQSNGGGWHHSNWFFVPEGTYMPNPETDDEGATEEGTWRCEDRGFRERGAAAVGGVFFAQSTQAFEEEQRFPVGAALEIPPNSVIVGQVHLLNLSAAPLTSALQFDLTTTPASEVDTPLQLVNLSNGSLAIPDGGESRFGMTCDLGSVFDSVIGETPDYSIYYVLPHYHEWGNYFRLSVVDDEGNDETVYELSRGIGEALGRTLDPPFRSRGARYMRMECGYLNDTGDTITWGFQGKEMCETLVYIDGGVKMAGGAQGEAVEVDSVGGLPTFETECGPLNGVSDLGGGGAGLPVCGSGNTYLDGEYTATQRIECDVAGAVLLGLDVEVSAIPLDDITAGSSVGIELSSRVEIDAESAALLNTISRGEPAIINDSFATVQVSDGQSDTAVTLGLDEAPCEVDYSGGATPVVPPSVTAVLEVAEDATEVTITLREFTLVSRTPSPSYLTTGPLPDDAMGQILSQCTATDAVLTLPVSEP
ncbi:MAG: hypothetical protein AAF500_21590 [Myxococcota bacterium]